MTTINASNIEFLLSGGTNNSDPSKSVGGDPSSFPVLGSLNNLFSDVTSADATSGKTDYRCFYIKNSDSSGSLYDASVSVSAQSEGGSYADIGIAKSTDVQVIDITGVSISGTLVLRLGNTPISMNWGESPFGFSASLRNALGYVGVPAAVDYTVSGNTASFTVTFSGASDNKNWPALQIQENNLTGVDAPVVRIRKMAQGQPTNSSAPLLATDSMPPAGVTFSSTAISVGTLSPGDFVPVWIRRITPPNTQFSENDGLTVKILGKPFIFSESSSSSS